MNEQNAQSRTRVDSATEAEDTEAERTDISPSRAEDPSPGRLLRIATSCPRCGSRPALRITEEVARGLGGHVQRTRFGTYQCQHRGCKTIYDLYLTRGLLNEELGGVA